MLQELGEMAMDLARALHGEALAEAEMAAAIPADQPAARAEAAERAGRLAGAFARVARAVRQTVALETRLERLAEAGLPTGASGRLPGQPDGAMTPAEREALRQAEEEARRVLGRAAVLNALEPLVLAEPCEDERDRLLEDLYERLYSASAEPDFARQDLWRMVERIRGELGLVVPPEHGPIGPPPGRPWLHRGALGRQGRDP